MIRGAVSVRRLTHNEPRHRPAINRAHVIDFQSVWARALDDVRSTINISDFVQSHRICGCGYHAGCLLFNEFYKAKKKYSL